MSRVTQDTARPPHASHTGLSPSTAALSSDVPLAIEVPTARSYNPRTASLPSGFGLFPGRSPLLGESLFIFSSSGY